MANTSSAGGTLERLRATRVWKSVFRRGPARTNRTRSVAVFGNLFLHFLPVKVRERSLAVRASYYLGSLSFLLFVLLTITGILLMFYYHPAVPQAYRDMKDLRFVNERSFATAQDDKPKVIAAVRIEAMTPRPLRAVFSAPTAAALPSRRSPARPFRAVAGPPAR